MIVNMYVDHLMATPPASSEEVWNATREHAKLFSDAAERIGLSAAEYREFRLALLDGKAAFVKLPRRVDAMSGDRRGSVYAVHNAVMTSTVMGWRVPLHDGNIVYVPQVCGNISLLRPVHVAVKPLVHHPVRHIAYRPHAAGVHHVPTFHKAVAEVPKETPVSMEAPVTEAPVEIPEAAPTVAQVVPAVSGGGGGFLFIIPALLGGIIAGVTHGGNNTTPSVPPPCSNGSNSFGACSTSR